MQASGAGRSRRVPLSLQSRVDISAVVEIPRILADLGVLNVTPRETNMNLVTVTWLPLGDEEPFPSDALSSDEEAFADKLLFEADRHRFRRCRALVRQVLGSYIELSPAEVRFSYGDSGKPYLAGYPELHFNVSHSRNLALIAVARQMQIGVDLEWIDTTVDVPTLSEQYFSRTERAALRSLPATRRVEAFFSCWTQKEALVKGVGCGMSLPLRLLETSIGKDQLQFVDLGPLHAGAGVWVVRTLSAPSGFIAALAISAKEVRIRINNSYLRDSMWSAGR